jgi:hypothetical protein
MDTIRGFDDTHPSRLDDGPPDRYAARNAKFVLVAGDRMAVLPARSAARDAGNQPRALPGYQGRAPGWFRTEVS